MADPCSTVWSLALPTGSGVAIVASRGMVRITVGHDDLSATIALTPAEAMEAAAELVKAAGRGAP